MEKKIFVSEEKYKEALERVNAYETRKKKLENIKEQISFLLETNFAAGNYKFHINKRKGTVVFVGYDKTNVMRLGIAYCDPSDKFNPVIGKIIAIQKAFNKSIKDFVDLAEPVSKPVTVLTGMARFTDPSVMIAPVESIRYRVDKK